MKTARATKALCSVKTCLAENVVVFDDCGSLINGQVHWRNNFLVKSCEKARTTTTVSLL